LASIQIAFGKMPALALGPSSIIMSRAAPVLLDATGR